MSDPHNSNTDLKPSSNPWRQHLRQDVQSMHAYAVQDSRGMVKLDAMENPFSLPPELQQQLGERLGALALNRYPGDRINVLRAELAKYAQMPDGFDIMLGNGSDELITLLSVACDVPGASFLAPLPGFVMYAMSAQLQGLAFHGVPLTADFELDEAAMLAAIETHEPSIVYLAYPNNPTANLWDDDVIERIVQPLGRRIDEKSPMVDARLPDGSRVNAVIPPLAIDGPSITIRKFSKDPFKVDDLVRFGAFTPELADFLRACVEARLNIVISGGTGARVQP